MTDLDHTQQVKQVWEQVSDAWERHRDHVFEQTRQVSERLIECIAPQPGETVLELGAGPGETGFLAAVALEPGGRLISTDVSPGMVDAARRGAEHRGLTNVEHRVMDAQQIDLPDAAVDAVVSRFAFMLIPDPPRVFAEIGRVLRPGGRLAYAVWGAIDRNPWVTTVIGAVVQNGHTPPGTTEAGPFGPGGMFSLAAREANTDALAAAGFRDVGLEEVTGAMRFSDFDEYWSIQTSLAGPIAQLFATLSPEQIAAIRESTEAGAAPFRTSTGYELPFTANVVTARRPEG